MTATVAVVVSAVIALFNVGCLDLVVASSNEKYELLSDIAKSYQAPAVDRKCVTVRVIQKASGTAERSLARGWVGETQPRPHVWSPAARTWLLLLTQDRTDAGLDDIVPRVAQSLIQSPLVIAMPEQMKKALIQFEPKIGWEQIAKLAQNKQGWATYGMPWGPFKLGKTNPTISTSGLHALISVNNAAQRSIDPDGFLNGVEESVVHYGDTVANFLSNLRLADTRHAALAYVSAIAVEEKQVFDYNRGNPRSVVCRGSCPFPEPTEKLDAIYPTDGTVVADHPFAILTWTDDARRQAASDFERYLETPEIQSRFQAEGFRNYLGQPGAPLTQSHFQASGSKLRWEPPDPADLKQLLTIWSTKLRKPAQALFVVDIGSSMANPAPGEIEAKLDLAKRAASEAIRDLGPKDTVGLWTFPTRDGTPYRKAADLATLAPRTSDLVRDLALLSTSSDEESLYTTIRAGVDELRSNFAPDRINALVVLTGGGFNLDAQRAAELIAYLQNQSEAERVRVFMVAYGTAPTSIDVLKLITASSGGAFYDITEPAYTTTEWVRNAMSNF